MSEEINVAERMRKAVTAIEEWAGEHLELCVEAIPECEDTWNKDYAIIEFSMEGTGDFFDWGAAFDDLLDTIRAVFDGDFEVLRGSRRDKKLEPGKLYLQIWDREIEAYRYQEEAHAEA